MRWFALLLAGVVLLGCSAKEPPEAARAAPAGDGTFTTTDVAWLQLADALHARALPLLELAPERADSRSLTRLAARLVKEHAAGRGRLRALLARAGVTEENPHTQHDMPGMPTAGDLQEAAGLRAGAFDRRFAALLRTHLEQLVRVADGERGSGGQAEVRGLAAAMAREHAADLAELERAAAA
ncbi:DUF305 domain-containing protein [Nonomuraea sp. MG754425]|uniref:DUF305 domain-containing protein n=1 Tax=Nonomuraea sp. MG754425 TaxID=2570319 RepID=UPI001F2D5111|nr:DUF305 domain-containing protein [Nonomuraea sp. MG754425]